MPHMASFGVSYGLRNYGFAAGLAQNFGVRDWGLGSGLWKN